MTGSMVLEGLHAYTSHAEWERTHPADLEHAQNLAAAAQRHLDAELREFPCPGQLRELDPNSQIVVLACDHCSFETSFKRSRSPASNADAFIESTAAQEAPF